VAEPIVDLRALRRVGEELLPLLPRCRAAAPFWNRVDLDAWMIEHAARLASADREVHVSVGAASLARDDFGRRIEGVLHHAGAAASKITLALDEQVLACEAASAERFARETSRLGLRLAVCDVALRFGSTHHLGAPPVQDLKIDPYVVGALTTDPECLATVARIVKIARDRGQRTIAQNPGDLETLVALQTLGVDCAQGFKLDRAATRT
jgi:EAL domain-containing protein (putative c-di-GMP-specific phosphodiesterase class I)